ncbi:MAG: TetR/AcrR family transcriptional regulator [Alphaproteobacteria bacterium]
MSQASTGMAPKRRAVARPKRRPTRAEKTEETRRALFIAAGKVVGKHGYAGASISRITNQAKVAQGTFYNYFETRQHLFDQLLPALGGDLLERINARVGPEPRGAAREEKRLRAWFAYLDEHPEFLRILNEAEIFAPRAYQSHMENFIRGYCRALDRSRSRGETRRLDDETLEVVAIILLAARGYLGQRYARRNRKPMLEAAVRGYMTLVRHGLFRK